MRWSQNNDKDVYSVLKRAENFGTFGLFQETENFSQKIVWNFRASSSQTQTFDIENKTNIYIAYACNGRTDPTNLFIYMADKRFSYFQEFAAVPLPLDFFATAFTSPSDTHGQISSVLF